MKEYVFREYTGVVPSDQQPTVRYQWGASVQDADIPAVTVAWLDPTGRTVGMRPSCFVRPSAKMGHVSLETFWLLLATMGVGARSGHLPIP